MPQNYKRTTFTLSKKKHLKTKSFPLTPNKHHPLAAKTSIVKVLLIELHQKRNKQIA